MATRRKIAMKTAPVRRRATASSRFTFAIAANASRPIRERIAALMRAPLAICENDQNLQTALQLLRGKHEPLKLRLAALQALQTASFSFVAFQPCRSDYIAVLREVATDADPEIRQRVLGMLARDRDGYAQKMLLEGLSHPEKALVPPEKAMQLLSYDVHVEAYAAARAIVGNPPNADARREALRLLAVDAKSAPLFEKLLRDKSELREIRQVAAAALHALQPEKFQAHARELLNDQTEYDDIQATCLTAISNFSSSAAISDDATLLKNVDRFRNRSSTKAAYRAGARRFMEKFSR